MSRWMGMVACTGEEGAVCPGQYLLMLSKTAWMFMLGEQAFSIWRY
jgi:hypothetical protein